MVEKHDKLRQNRGKITAKAWHHVTGLKTIMQSIKLLNI